MSVCSYSSPLHCNFSEKARTGAVISPDEIPAAPAISASPEPLNAAASLVPSATARTAAPVPARITAATVTPSPEKRQAVEERQRDDTPPNDPGPIARASAPSKMQVDEIRSVLTRRRDAYRKNMALANNANDKMAAVDFFNMAKQFDAAIEVRSAVHHLNCLAFRNSVYVEGCEQWRADRM